MLFYEKNLLIFTVTFRFFSFEFVIERNDLALQFPNFLIGDF